MLNSGVSLQRLATKAGVGFTPKKLFSNGEAGVWYDPSDVEASLTWRRNLLEYTESFDNDYYTAYFQKPTFTTGQADPLGGYNAMKWNASTTTGSSDGTKGGFYRGDSGGVIKENTDYTVSVWLKATAPIVVSIGLMDGGSQNVSVTTSWQRFSVTLQKSTNPVHQARLFQLLDANNANVDIYVFGAQTEEGSTATEYQPIRSTFDNAFKQAFPRHTLYQDEEGKNPVTGMGQAVGLMLDKSKGLQFGDELVVNGTYDSNINGWTVPTGSASTISYSNGALAATRGNEAIAVSTLSTSVVTGKTYRLEFDIVSKSDTSGWVYVKLNNFMTDQNSTYGKSTGKKIYTFTATAGANIIEIFAGGVASFSFVIDNVSLVELSGSTATQSDSTKRPVFARHPERGRVNLFKYTEEFDNGYWTANSAVITANAITAPDGTNTAEKLVATATTSEHKIDRAHTNIDNFEPLENNVISVYAKSGGYNYLGFRVNINGTWSQALYNLSNGTLGNSNGSWGERTIEDVGNGWYRCTALIDNVGGTTVQIHSQPTNSVNPVYTGNAVDGIYIWGAQLEEANEATGYQKVVDDYDITESGYKSVYYLQFDGINDTMTIQPISNTTAPVSVFMGHDTEGNTGTSAYFLDVEVGRFIVAGAGYYHGSAWVGATGVDPEAKGVTSVISDGTNADYRRDGIEETTGTLANKQLSGLITIFSRHDGTTYHTNGNMYQLVIRGATSTDKEIDQAEEFVAIKTGLKSEVVGQATLDLNFGANTYTARNSNGSVL